MNNFIRLAVMWIIGGAIYPFLSEVTSSVDLLNIIFIRSVGAALILFVAVALTSPSSLKLIRFDRRLLKIGAIGLIFSPICGGAVAWASSKEPGAVISLTYSILPAIAVVYAVLQGSKPTRNSVIGVAIATLSVAFLIGAPSESVSAVGITVAFLSVIAWFIGTQIWIKFDPGYPILLATAIQVTASAIAAGLLKLFISTPAIKSEDVLNINMIFLIAALAAQYWAYMGLADRVSPELLTSFAFINPLVAGVIGFSLFNQSVSQIQIIAGAILLVGVYIVVREDLKKTKKDTDRA
jgi:drug/metabolite transporter (DMT)-like permease